MNQYVFLFIIIVFQLARALYLTLKRKSTNHLWVSFFIICIPFEIVRVIGDTSITTPTGTLGPLIKFTLPLALSFIVIFKSKLSKMTFKIKSWVSIVLLLIIISLFNPYNEDYSASAVFAVFFISHIILFKILASFIDYPQLLKGIYDGFSVLCVVQFVLALCFPLIGLIEVTEFFHKGGELGATRVGGRNGAIGLFFHPGELSLFTVMASSFFLSTYLFNYDKKLSFLLLGLNTITIILTYSRTSYLAFIILIFLLVFIKKNSSKNLFSISNIFKFVLPVTLAISWLIFLSPFGEIFLKSDTDVQYQNRTTHYKIAYHLFKESPVIGVGLNSHLTYIEHHPAILSAVTNTEIPGRVEFFRENPIHNIHLILLAETGLIGLILWIFFILSNIVLCKNQIAEKQNEILSLTFIGVLVSVCFYGMTGWSPLCPGDFPFFLLIAFFAIKYRTDPSTFRTSTINYINI